MSVEKKLLVTKQRIQSMPAPTTHPIMPNAGRVNEMLFILRFLVAPRFIYTNYNLANFTKISSF